MNLLGHQVKSIVCWFHTNLMPWATPHLNTQQVQVFCVIFSAFPGCVAEVPREGPLDSRILPLSFGGFWMILDDFRWILDDFGHANLWHKLHIDVENGQQLEPNMTTHFHPDPKISWEGTRHPKSHPEYWIHRNACVSVSHWFSILQTCTD